MILLSTSFPMKAEFGNQVDDQFDSVSVDRSEAYDDFDCMADQLSDKGMAPVEPQELSKTVIFLRKVGGSLFMKYLAVKGWTKGMWQKLFHSQPSIVHAPDCPHYKVS